MPRGLAILTVLCAFLFTTGGCGDATIDASDQATLEKSVEEIAKGLEPDKRDKFEQSVQQLMMSKVLFAPGDVDAMNKNVKTVFDGKTADEIIEEGDKAKAANDAAMKKLMDGN